MLKDVIYRFETVLEDNGFVVDLFDDPILALNYFKPDLYDLVLVDIKMPEMDGFKHDEEMKKFDNKFTVRFLTASETFYEQYRSTHSVMTGKECQVIQKPIKNEELLEKIILDGLIKLIISCIKRENRTLRRHL